MPIKFMQNQTVDTKLQSASLSTKTIIYGQKLGEQIAD
jgi:hypothetical protein